MKQHENCCKNIEKSTKRCKLSVWIDRNAMKLAVYRC